MDKFVVQGGRPLRGDVRISGSKNASLPALAACLLTDEEVILHQVPRVKDIRTMEKLLQYIGVQLHKPGNGPLHANAKDVSRPEAPYDVVKTMRASSLVLGPLLARTGRARVSLPGGCAIGARPIDLHMGALEQLGARMNQTQGYIEAVAPEGLRGAHVKFERITVTGTEDVLMAAVLAKGETTLENAAREPEVVDLANLLIKMGAQIEGAGTSHIRVTGVDRLGGAEHVIIPDRIEAGTFLIAGAITKGDLRLTHCEPEHLEALTDKMKQAGVRIEIEDATTIRVCGDGSLRATDVVTQEHPGFATDLQAQYMTLMTQAEGISFVTETIFENRFMHVPELARMGANIRVEGRQAIIAKSHLGGAQVICSDLRASASLVLAGLVAQGETTIDRVYHIDRGYESIETKLNRVGASIKRLEDGE